MNWEYIISGIISFGLLVYYVRQGKNDLVTITSLRIGKAA
jgi:hypothetical protein